MNSVSEKIDERILRLLSLEDVFDIDYDTYLTLLKEAIVTGSKKLPEEELALLANERKRIRGKKGRFKPKKDKITADKVATTKLLKGTKVSKKTLALSTAISKPDIQQQDLTGIGKPLESISKTLAALLKFSKKTSEEERRDKETQKRNKREEGLEGFKKGISAVSGAAKKMLAPFQSIIDRIWKFIFFTLLGRAFTQLMGWLGDPANKKKIEVLGRFLKDWWPALAFAAGLFLTPFGAFIRTTIGAVRAFIPQLIALTTNPAFLALAGAAAGGIAGASLESNLRKVDETLLQRRIKEAKDQGKPLSKQEIEKIKLEQLQKRVQDIQGTNIPGSALLASGGIVPRFSMGGINFGTGYGGIDGSTGQKVSGFGPDTQAIIAQPGEIVINKKTVDAVGADHFLGLNRQYGGPGANKPKMGRLYNNGGEVQRFQNGGMVGSNKSGQVGGQTNLLKPQAKTIFDRLVKGGLTPNAAAGVVANIGVETGYTYDPNTHQRGGGPGRGLVQWERGGRFDTDRINLMSFAKSRGTPWNNLNTQTDFILHELNTHPEYQRVKSKINTAKDVPTATNIFLRDYEKAGTPHTQDRMKVAQQIVNAGYLKPKEKPEEKLNKKPPTFIDRLGQIANKVGSGFSGMFRPSPATAKPQRWVTDPRGLFGMQGGGQVNSNTGMDISGTADTQLTRLQRGEYVLPLDTVNRLGVSAIDHLVAMTDSNSNAARLGKRNINQPQITPLNRGQSGMMTLPPITQSASGGGADGSAAGSKVPVFSASSPSGAAERSVNIGNYGIVG